ncbi:MAG: hypothetical protein ACK4RK_08710 [Gemmataceae bacterium]
MTRCLRLMTGVCLIPLFAFATLGCGGNGTPTTPDTTTDTTPTKKEMTKVAATGWGKLSGKVTLDGTPPPLSPPDFKSLAKALPNPEAREVCLEGDLTNPRWKVGADNSVANVVVFLRPVDPKTQYFDIPAEILEEYKSGDKSKATLDQPFCAFVPHVQTLFAFYSPDGKKTVPTGQTFSVVNSAPIPHNTNYQGGSRQPKGNTNLKPNDEKGITLNIPPDYFSPLRFKCDIHGWMEAYAWSLDHPFAAVTNEKGEFVIDKVPAGADVDIYYWHESFGTKPPQKLETVKFTDGDNEKNFSIQP